MLDLLYRQPNAKDRVAASSLLGREIYAYTSTSSSSATVQERRKILADMVDATVQRKERPEILSVACGHLREAELSTALSAGKLNRWLAFDQDEANLAIIAASRKDTAVEPFAGSVKGLIGGYYDLGRFDFAYTAGVYDYLPLEGAAALTGQLLEMLKPGGELLFANFSTEVVPDGYMETFMNWQLILRGEWEMWNIMNAAMGRHTVEAEVFFGQNRHIVYAKLRKTCH